MPPADEAVPDAAAEAAPKRAATDAPTEWNTSPLFEPQGGPDGMTDAAAATMNGVVALWRKVMGWFRRG
jgi:hypothetical protein